VRLRLCCQTYRSGAGAQRGKHLHQARLATPLGPTIRRRLSHLEADAPEGLSSIRVSQSEVLDDQHAR